MKVLLDIKDDKADFFMELLKNFSFVKAKPLEEPFTASQSEKVQRIQQALDNIPTHDIPENELYNMVQVEIDAVRQSSR